MTRGVIIQGSARSFGNTNRVVRFMAEKRSLDIIDLKEKKIGQFDYEFKNNGDDFIPLMREIIGKYDFIIFATPVYWYSMSGIMKAFFDRISDLLKIEKELGRQLRGKKMGLVSCGSDQNLPEGFAVPFVETANYLGMEYSGDVHTWIENRRIPELARGKLEKFLVSV